MKGTVFQSGSTDCFSITACPHVSIPHSVVPSVNGFLLVFVISDVDKLQSLPELAYHGLWLLCSSSHGEGNEVRRLGWNNLFVLSDSELIR